MMRYFVSELRERGADRVEAHTHGVDGGRWTSGPGKSLINEGNLQTSHGHFRLGHSVEVLLACHVLHDDILPSFQECRALSTALFSQRSNRKKSPSRGDNYIDNQDLPTSLHGSRFTGPATFTSTISVVREISSKDFNTDFSTPWPPSRCSGPQPRTHLSSVKHQWLSQLRRPMIADQRRGAGRCSQVGVFHLC